MTLLSNSDMGVSLELIRDKRSLEFNGFPDWRESSISFATDSNWLRIWAVFRLANVAWCGSADEKSTKDSSVTMARLETDSSSDTVELPPGPLADRLRGGSLGAPVEVSDSAWNCVWDKTTSSTSPGQCLMRRGKILSQNRAQHQFSTAFSMMVHIC